MSSIFKKTTVTKSTWNGRAGTSTSYLLTTKSLGRRIVAHVWDDDPSVVEFKAMTGSFWRGPAGKIFAERTCYFHSEGHLLEMASQMASETF